MKWACCPSQDLVLDVNLTLDEHLSSSPTGLFRDKVLSNTTRGDLPSVITLRFGMIYQHTNERWSGFTKERDRVIIGKETIPVSTTLLQDRDRPLTLRVTFQANKKCLMIEHMVSRTRDERREITKLFLPSQFFRHRCIACASRKIHCRRFRHTPPPRGEKTLSSNGMESPKWTAVQECKLTHHIILEPFSVGKESPFVEMVVQVVDEKPFFPIS
mmetsp:Transcript_18553/g.46702  ORF Transcript_18553/g.46702 Transcript_18553/m.46702 type:complete len:215 (+) Transcript_18553:1453-2097(+)